MQAQLDNTLTELKQTRGEVRRLEEQLTNAQQKRNTASRQLAKTETQGALKNIPNMGNYYALIIGINDYQFPLTTLKTPVNDARRIEQVLRQNYGFKTQLLVDDGDIKPTRDAFYKAMRKLRNNIKEGDNFLIYFAGHGVLRANRAHWLPQNALSEDDNNWLSTDDITKKIEYRGDSDSMKARHVLIIADSCYSAAMATSWLEPSSRQVIAALPEGLVTRSSHSTQIISRTNVPVSSLQPAGLSQEERGGWIMAQYKQRSRRELTSGGIEPVLDQADKDGLSIFANAFLGVLEANEGIIGASEIHAAIGPQVVNKTKKAGKSQTPVYAPIPETGDNHGEFYFFRSR